MSRDQRFDRQRFLALGGLGVLAAGGLAGKNVLGGALAGAAPGAPIQRRFVATDGHIALPGRPGYPFGSDPADRVPDLFVMGFVEAPIADYPMGSSIALVTQDFKGKVKDPAPIVEVDEGQELMIVLTNVGFLARPDLDDSHTIHWHGFRKPIALFDGVPEVTIAVPPYRDFPYVYKPHDEGTYMYHCHFEDSEHVQMQMTGIVFVNPAKGSGFAYDDDAGADTSYDRQFTLLLNEIWTTPHDNLERIQESVWSDYDPNYWVINSRSYPDTVERGSTGPGEYLESQPLSSLMQVNPLDRVLMRMANLGYEQQSMQLVGIPMRVVGEDATFLLGQDGTDLSYLATSIYIGPGEARDVIFTAPLYNGTADGSDVIDGTPRDYNRYYLANRSSHKNINPGSSDLGGQVTEVRVYDGSPLPVQAEPNETYA